MKQQCAAHVVSHHSPVLSLHYQVQDVGITFIIADNGQTPARPDLNKPRGPESDHLSRP